MIGSSSFRLGGTASYGVAATTTTYAASTYAGATTYAPGITYAASTYAPASTYAQLPTGYASTYAVTAPAVSYAAPATYAATSYSAPAVSYAAPATYGAPMTYSAPAIRPSQRLSQATGMQSGGAKFIYFVRHGQAAHNVNAEALKEKGCTHEQFIQQMKDDDEFDAALTVWGRAQAEAAGATAPFQAARLAVELVVSSPLSRAIDTADLTFPDDVLPRAKGKRVSLESIREINGYLLNGKRRSTKELQELYPVWDFTGLLTDEDESWSPTVETNEAAQDRAYQSLCWLWARPEQNIAVVAHGGIYMLLMDGKHEDVEISEEGLSQRFGNCELRKIVLRSIIATEDGDGISDAGYHPRLRFQLELAA